MENKIQSAYQDSKNYYDDILTHNGFLSKLYNNIFWSGTNDLEIADILLSNIPDNFSGKILDIPVGTAVFTKNKWNNLKDSIITCVDISIDMLNQAKEKLKQPNINLIKGDVGNLPFEDNYFDIILSMNGFHAFPDKEKAFKEIYRVLKKGGFFIGCFYIKGESRITDWLVNNILSKKGWFSPPFYTKEEVHQLLSSKYFDINLNNNYSIIYFSCIKS